MTKPKHIDAHSRVQLELQIRKQHPNWSSGQVLARAALELAKMRNRKSFHIHGVDQFTIRAIKYIGAIRGETVAEVVSNAIDAEVGQYPDLCRARDEQKALLGPWDGALI